MTIDRNYIGLLLTAAAALTALTACSSDDGPLGTDSQKEIRLASAVSDGEGVVTRSNDAPNLVSGDTVYVWTDMVNPMTPTTVSPYFNAWALKANGVGGLSTLASGNAKLFPATNSLNFYALKGNFGTKTVGEQLVPKITDGEDVLPDENGIRHTVLSDQRTSEAFYKSDLLYAVKLNQEPISEAVVLPFNHMLSRIQVVLVPGNGMSKDDLTATVELVGLKLQATITPVRGTETGTLSIPQGATTGNILMGTNVVATVDAAKGDQNKSVYADAIVVPQTIASGAPFIKVSYLDRDTYYSIPTTADFTIESGKQYRFRLICDRIGETYELVGKSGNEITVETWGAAPTTPTGLWLDTVVE